MSGAFQPLVCSRCFVDQGLRRDAAAIGVTCSSPCPNCGSTEGEKLDKDLVLALADRFFVRGTLLRLQYGGAPLIVFNEMQADSARLRGEIDVPVWLEADVRLIEKAAGIGFFYYGPHDWMLGEVEPLRALQDPSRQSGIINRIVSEYPVRSLSMKDTLYRLRHNPKDPSSPSEYDSPPDDLAGRNRLDAPQLPILYASQDLELCVHECRVTVEDDLFVATMRPTRDLKLLDLSEILKEDVTEFDSLDMAIHMLFLAADHSYPISRAIAAEAKNRGFDGIIYPSYFSLVRLGVRPFDTVYGISLRRINAAYARTQIIENVGIFGRPVEAGLVEVTCINRLVLNRILYDFLFGPALTPEAGRAQATGE